MSFSQSIYNHLPVFLQNAACSLHGRRLLKNRYDADFRRFLAELDESQWWEQDRLKEYQNKKVRELMAHAYENVPYYHRVMKERGLTPKDFETADDLVKMPYLTKEIVRQEGGNMVAKNIDLRKNATFYHTSGSTGAGLRFWNSNKAIRFHWALVWRHRERFDLKLFQPYVHFGGQLVVPYKQKKPPFWRENRTFNQTYCSTRHLKKDWIGYYIEMLEARDYDFYAGYTSAFAILATYLQDRGHPLSRPPRVIDAGSESLSADQRHTISKWLGARVIGNYGMSEGVANGGWCSENVLHVDTEFCVIESTPIDDTNRSHIIGTSLHNDAQPFIRYKTNDIATFSDSKCPCGLHSPVIGELDGRIEDMIVTSDGRHVGRLSPAFRDIECVKEVQLIQKNLENIIVKVVPGKDYDSSSERRITEELNKYLGNMMKYTFQVVDEIPRAKSGKMRLVISEISGKTYRDVIEH